MIHNIKYLITKQFISILFLLILPFMVIVAEDDISIPESDTAIFISSIPLNAEIILDENFFEGRTPLFIQGLSEGRHTIILSKDGFKKEEYIINLLKGDIHTISADLEETAFYPVFTGESSVIWNGGIQTATNGDIGIEDGNYSIYRRNDTIHIDPIFPEQNLLSALDLLFPATILYSSLITVNDILNPSSVSHKVSAASAISWGVVLVTGLMDYVINLRKNDYLQNVFMISGKDDSETNAYDLYQKGELLLTEGNIAESLSAYIEILELYKESRYFPLSLYKTGRIHFLTGDTILAEVEFKRLLDHYPLPEIYDKTCKSLADLLYKQRRYEEAIKYIDSMIFIDPFFTENEIKQYRKEIKSAWEN